MMNTSGNGTNSAVTGIAPEQKRLGLERVSNGWVIGGFDWQRGQGMHDQFVARTPGELAELIGQWAARQLTDAKA